MVLASPVEAPIVRPEHGLSYPSSIISDWVQIQSDIDQAEPDTGVVIGGVVVRPDLITRATQAYFRPQGLGTHMLLSVVYDDGLTAITDAVVRVFGRDRNSVWHVLEDSGGNDPITLATDATNDVQDGTNKMTIPVSIDMQGSELIIVGIQTAFAGTGDASTATVWAKVINNR